MTPANQLTAGASAPVAPPLYAPLYPRLPYPSNTSAFQDVWHMWTFRILLQEKQVTLPKEKMPLMKALLSGPLIKFLLTGLQEPPTEEPLF